MRTFQNRITLLYKESSRRGAEHNKERCSGSIEQKIEQKGK